MGDLHRRLIAFDLDGTLIDSRQDLADSANELIAELGGARLSTVAIAAMVGEGAAVLVRRALAASGLPERPGSVARFLAIYDTRLLNHTRLYDDVRALLSYSRTVGAVAVVTNKPLAPTERILSGLDVRALVDHVVGGDGPYPRKPDPAGLLEVMRRVGALPESTLLVGDSSIDLETARRAGVSSCMVRYGFGRVDAPAGPNEWVVDDVAGVMDVVGRFAETPTQGLG